MTAPSYTTDLLDIIACGSATSYEEFTGYALGDNAAPESDWFIKGGWCASDEANGKTGVGHSIGYDYGSDLAGSFAAGDCVFVWMFCMAPNGVDTYANGGYRVLIGSTTANFDGWVVGGSDYARNPYGGWTNVVVDPTHTADYTGGTGLGAVWQHFAAAFNLSSAISKGRPLNMGGITYGRGEIIVEFGELTLGYATCAGMAVQNDTTTNRWGLFQEAGGGYLWKGLWTLGTATNAVDFRDEGITINIDDTVKTYTAFNAIEVNNASSRVDMTGFVFKALGTAAPGTFEMVANADVNIDGSRFEGMGTFIFLSNGACIDSSFVGCGIITAGDADFSGTSVEGFEGTADTAPFVWDVATDPLSDTEGMAFTIGTALTHAMEFGTTSPRTINLQDIDFSGYHASDSQTSSTFLVKHVGGVVAINCSGCTGELTYKATAGATVTVAQTTTVTLTGLKDSTEIRVYSQAATPVELAGIEDVTAGTADDRTFSFSLTAAITVDIRILQGDSAAADGLHYENTAILDYVIPASTTSIPVQQSVDRNFGNPA